VSSGPDAVGDWQEHRLSAIFTRVLEASPTARGPLLAALCGADADLARTVAELVAASERAASTGHLRAQLFAAEHKPLPDGTRIGAYEIRRVIATGGMGIVYLAHDVGLDVPVALKALHPELAGTDAQRHRLRDEARIAARLSSHPNIATIHALVEHEGAAFIVSEYVRGRTLRACLEEGPLAPATAIEAVLAVLDAVGAAHREGVVHRDLKPENVMRTEEGTYKVLDFGIARPEAPDPQQTATATGEAAGTLGYMAPEQLRGIRVDRRADIFAAGVLLYELVTGRHPFRRDGGLSTWRAVLLEPPAPFTPAELARVPAGLPGAIACALEKDPAARFASATAFADTLRRIAAGHPAAIPGPSGDVGSGSSSAVAWWQFHEGLAAIVYWLLLIPVWHVRGAVAFVDWRWLFFTLLAAVCVAPSLRLSLWFVSDQHPGRARAHHARCRPWLRVADAVFAGALTAAGLAISGSRAGWATLLIAFGVGSLAVATFVEPLTAEAALDALDPRRGRDGHDDRLRAGPGR
jgi:predicted Ser/Thr protein kinase